MKQDYLSHVLPPTQPAVRASEIPGAKDVGDADQEASALHESLDMVHFSEAESAEIGGASSPAEAELNRLYAELTAQVPGLLPLIGREEGAMGSGYDMERALSVYQQANLGLLRVARAALVISAAELTAQNDRVEEAALSIAEDPAISPPRRAVIGNARRALDAVRTRQIDAMEQRKARRQRKSARHSAQLLLTEQRTAQRRRLAELAETPLPGGAPGTP